MRKGGKVDPKVKDVLKIVGAGSFLAAAFVIPGPTALVINEYRKYKWDKDRKEWNKFNLWRLKQVIKRLEKQKAVEVKSGEVRITAKGRLKVLKFNLEEMELKRKTDGKWRLIIYDITEMKRNERDIFRSFLKKLKFLRLQHSVYLTPYVCDDEIEYLKLQFEVGKEVQVLKVSGIENEQVYKEYFGI
jgi:CRISPR-associated endonuclease Cas2